MFLLRGILVLSFAFVAFLGGVRRGSTKNQNEKELTTSRTNANSTRLAASL
jgi:hypothetical protein